METWLLLCPWEALACIVHIKLAKYLEFEETCPESYVESVCVCVLWVREQLFHRPPHSHPFLAGWTCWWQPALGACGWPQWMKPCFCSPHLPLSAHRSLTFPLSPSVHSKDETRPLSCCPAQLRSVSLVCCNWRCEWATGRDPALQLCSTFRRVHRVKGSCGAATCLVLFVCTETFFVLFLVVEDDEDDFPNTRTDGEFLHNNNGSKEKCEYWRILP